MTAGSQPASHAACFMLSFYTTIYGTMKQMKKTGFIVFLCIMAGAVFAQKRGDTMYVAVQSVPVKTSTGFFAKTAGTLSYGSQVTVIAVSGKWIQVNANRPLNGWISAAAVTSKRIIAGSGQAASSKELAMAGKGFSEEVERKYRTEKNLNYDAVDDVEQVRISEEDLFYFIKEGRLAAGE
jgi:uncharacterized protein YgiM (DUF1202 family)